MADSGSQSGTSDSGRPWEEEHEVHSPPAPEGPTAVDWAVKAPASPLLPSAQRLQIVDDALIIQIVLVLVWFSVSVAISDFLRFV